MRISRVTLSVRDLDVSLAFYRDVLGLEIETAGAVLHLELGVELELRSHDENVGYVFDSTVTGLDRLVLAMRDLDSLVERLESAGVDYAEAGEGLLVTDPDGIALEINPE